MDSHVGIWVPNLHSVVEKLSDHKTIKMSFQGDGSHSDTTYYSIFAQACPGYFVEFISDESSKLNKEEFTKVDEPRLDFTNWKPSYFRPKIAKVSRATTKIKEMVHFYTEVIGGTVL